MDELQDHVTQALEAYKDAVFRKDVDALVGLYDPDVRVFDAWGVWSYESAQSWRGAIQNWLSSLGTERVVVSFEETHVTARAGSALVSTFVTYAGVSAEGERLRAMQNRLTWGMSFDGSTLRIVHEHTSAPLGFEDMKAILRR